MEEHENKTKGEENTFKSKNKNKNPLEGIDLDGFNIPDWLKHLLTGAGTLGANYLLFVKPLQEKVEAMNLAIVKQDSRIKELEKEQARLITELKQSAEQNLNGKTDSDGCFTTKRGTPNAGKSPNSYQSVRM